MEKNKTKETAVLCGTFRQARIPDARQMQELVRIYAEKGLMLHRSLSELFETIRQYRVYEEDGKIIGVCGLHISWEDLAEIRGLAIDPDHDGKGIGKKLASEAIGEAIELGIPRVFALTYVPSFFEKLGFREIDKSTFPHKIWSDCIKCHKFPDCDESGMILDLDIRK